MVNLHEVILYIITILPISTLFVNQSISNKVLFVLSMMIFGFVLVKRMRKSSFLMLILLFVQFVLSIYITGTLEFYNANDIFYLPLWVFLFLYLSQFHNCLHIAIQRRLQVIKYFIYIWEVIFVLLRVVSPTMNEDFAHRSASSAFLVIVFVWYVSKMTKNRLFNLHMIVPMIAIFVFEVRTYLVVSLIIVCMSYYSIFEKKRYFYMTIIPLSVLAVYFVLQTPIGERFINMTENYYGGWLASATNSRSVFWIADIKAIIRSSTFNKIFGSGYNFIYDVNVKAVETLIWGHNDIIHIAATNGLLGIIIYLKSFLDFVRKYKQEVLIDNKLFYLTIIALVICALVDGLYHYVCALYAVPFLFDGLKMNKINEGNNE